MNNNTSFKEVAAFIFEVLASFRNNIFVMYVVAVIWAVDLSLKPYVLKIIVDRVAEGRSHHLLEHVSGPAIIYFLMILIPPTIFRFYDYFISIRMIPSLRRTIADSSFNSLLKQSYSFYQNNFAGGLSNKVNDLTGNIPEIVQIVIDRFIAHLLAIIIAVIILWQVNYIFALVMFFWVTLCISGSILMSNKLSDLSDKWSECGSMITGKIVDSLSNILSVQLFARDKGESTSLSLACDEAARAEEKFQWSLFWIWFCYGYSFVMVQGLSLYFLLTGHKDGWITAGDFVVVLSINYSIIDLLWQFTKDFSQFSKLWGKVTQALRSIQTIPEIQDADDAKILRVKKGKIIFDEVKFHYKGTDPLFQNKSITIEASQKVGLVGYSGSGKTTFVNLILRLYEINQGRILIDNQDIKEVSQNSLRANIAMIAQDPSLFHRSLMDNIRYGRIEASDEEVILAAKNAHAHEFITNLPEAYETMVGERGIKLSGGQRQRISIARAFLKNAPILIMDEATSQLDSLTESYIQESLWELMQGKTTIVIAHRLSTLLHMDRILVFEKGKIIEDGTHQELLERNGLYKNLWESQVGGFLPEKMNGPAFSL